MEKKSWHRAARSHLNRTLNPECFINKINNHSYVIGWEISHVFAFPSVSGGGLGSEKKAGAHQPASRHEVQ